MGLVEVAVAMAADTTAATVAEVGESSVEHWYHG